MVVTLKIEKSVYGGDGMGRLGDGRVCFVPGVFGGETIRAELTEQKKNFTRAKAVEILEPSPHRITPPDFTIPGMVYANLDYAGELHAKEEQLGNFLERIGQSYSHIEVIAGRSANYRNKAIYHVQKASGKWLIGYRREFSHEVVDVPQDPLAVAPINSALGNIRNTVIALLSQGAARLRRETRDAETVTVRHTAKDGVKWWLGDAPRDLTLTECTCGNPFMVAADGFYQVNSEIGDKLVQAVSEAYAADTTTSPDIVDLYSGVGVFGLCCLRKANGNGRLTGIESVHSAVEFAKRNAAQLGIPARFFCEKVGGSLNRIRIGERTTVIADPPRGGMEKRVPEWLAASRAKRIFCVSCDPATLVRDLAPLVKTYRVKRVRLFDMFPRTARFETLVELEK